MADSTYKSFIDIITIAINTIDTDVKISYFDSEQEYLNKISIHKQSLRNNLLIHIVKPQEFIQYENRLNNRQDKICSVYIKFLRLNTLQNKTIPSDKLDLLIDEVVTKIRTYDFSTAGFRQLYLGNVINLEFVDTDIDTYQFELSLTRRT